MIRKSTIWTCLYLWVWNLVFNIHWNLTLTAYVRGLPVYQTAYMLACWVIQYPNKVDLCFVLNFMLQKTEDCQGLLCLRSWFCVILLSTLEEYRIYYHVPLLLHLGTGWSDSSLSSQSYFFECFFFFLWKNHKLT